MPRRLLQRHPTDRCLPCWLKGGIGATAAFLIIWAIGDLTGASLIIAPLGASAFLVFGMPSSPVSQPAHVVGGHLLAAAIGLLADRYLPAHPLTMAATVGLVIILLGLLHLAHPPAGATVLVVLMTHPGWMFLLTPVLVGSVTLVVMALVIHRMPPRVEYPLPLRESP